MSVDSMSVGGGGEADELPPYDVTMVSMLMEASGTQVPSVTAQDLGSFMVLRAEADIGEAEKIHEVLKGRQVFWAVHAALSGTPQVGLRITAVGYNSEKRATHAGIRVSGMHEIAVLLANGTLHRGRRLGETKRELFLDYHRMLFRTGSS
jgi:hypothetical protein